MKIFLQFCLLISFGMSPGCAFLFKHSSNEPEISEAEKNEIANAEKLLSERRFEEAKILYREFQGLHPNSFFFQAARLGEAQAQQNLGNYNEAAELCRQVNLATIQLQPEIAALAWYQMAFAYEALGEDHKAIAALLDAQKLADHLPPSVALAEIPARLAAAYGRQGNDREALESLDQAERGILKINADKSMQLKKDWLGKAYVQMGSISTNQVSAENFNDFVKGQKWVQVYLIKALRLNDANWSSQSQTKLLETYRDLYAVLVSTNSREIQKDMGGELIDLMDRAELYKPYADQKSNSYETAFFSYLSEVRKKTEDILYGAEPVMGLTHESEKLHSIRRSGRVNNETLLPEKRKSSIPLPPKTVPSEDPNL